MLRAIFVPIILLVFAGIGLTLLLWPSNFLLHIRNPWQPDTPENRVYVRGIGLVLCLFLIMAATGSVNRLEGLHRNMLVALWASFLFLPIFFWVLWQFSPLRQMNRRHLAGDSDTGWELWMSLAFSGLLSAIVLIAFFLARKGYYPKWTQN